MHTLQSIMSQFQEHSKKPLKLKKRIPPLAPKYQEEPREETEPVQLRPMHRLSLMGGGRSQSPVQKDHQQVTTRPLSPLIAKSPSKRFESKSPVGDDNSEKFTLPSLTGSYTLQGIASKDQRY